MRSYPVPFNEAARLDALAALGAISVAADEPDPVLDGIAALARAMTGFESALVSLVNVDQQVFVARADFPVGRTSRDLSICAHVVARERAVVVEDTLADPVFRDHPVVVGPPHVRSYAGAPIRLSSGLVMGSLCALGTAPHAAPSCDVLARLSDLASLVAHILEERARRGGRGPALDEAADRAHDEFLALIGHELRTPLNGIIGVSQMLDPSPEERHLVEALRNSSALLGRLIEQVMTFSDLRAGSMAPRDAAVPAFRIVEAARSSLAPRLEAENRPPIEVDMTPGLVLIGDADMLALALDCLAGNAVAHGGRRVRLSATRDDEGCATLAVEDDGTGIDEARREAELRPFGHGAPLTKRAADGLGLGLPLTRRLIELHGGELVLEGGPPFRAALRLPRWRLIG